MRRMLLALALVVGLFAFPSTASATHDLLDFQSAVDAMLAVDPTLDPPPDDPTKDFAVGGINSFRSIAFSAHRDGPKAEDAWGYLSTEGVRYRVVCLAVLGQKAALGLLGQSRNALPTNSFIVRDSGLPGGTGDTFTFNNLIPPEDCEAGLLVEPPFTGQGNILVHDAQP